jgi:FixJ family two-component response regulator
MPGMSGVELIERLKAEDHKLPAIMIAGSGAVLMAVQATALAAA